MDGVSGARDCRDWLSVHLRGAGDVASPLIMRLVMGWEFWQAGVEKYQGGNWFADVQSSFPFPFNVLPADLSWFLATWFELIGALMLWLGLGTRFFAFALLFLTFVATAAVHWPEVLLLGDLAKGYAITDRGYGNFKLPLLFAVMLLALVFNGAGRISLDHLIARRTAPAARDSSAAWSWLLACAVIGVPMLMLVPAAGAALLAAALLPALASRRARVS